MLIELGIGGVVAGFLFWLQNKLSRKVNNYILQKAELEHKYKASQCEIIVELLKDIQDREKSVKEILVSLKMGTPIDNWSEFLLEITVRPFKFKIVRMAEAMGKLQAKLHDTPLEREFLDYLAKFDMLPKRFFVDNLTDKLTNQGQEHLIKGIVKEIDEQLEKIQGFIDKFSKEVSE
jgi:hypothetical protein